MLNARASAFVPKVLSGDSISNNNLCKNLANFGFEYSLSNPGSKLKFSRNRSMPTIFSLNPNADVFIPSTSTFLSPIFTSFRVNYPYELTLTNLNPIAKPFYPSSSKSEKLTTYAFSGSLNPYAEPFHPRTASTENEKNEKNENQNVKNEKKNENQNVDNNEGIGSIDANASFLRDFTIPLTDRSPVALNFYTPVLLDTDL